MKDRVVAVIPARLNSSRFPNKVIYPFKGKPLLCYLVDSLTKSRLIDRLIVATDAKEIRDTMTSVGVETIMTSKRHRTGTDRAAEVAKKVPGTIFLNIQADNLGLKASVLDKVIARFVADRKEQYGTLVARAESDEDLADPNTVKVAYSADGYARWFSRLPLPYLQKAGEGPLARQFKFYRHIGIYLFRRAALKQFAAWKRSPYEKAESLEQLRVLENGGAMKGYMTTMRSVSVDSPADLEKVRLLYK